MNMALYIKTILIILTAISLSGCFPMSFIKNLGGIFQSDNSDNPYSEQNTNIKIIPLRIPESGEHLLIRDPKTDQEYSVTIGEVYTSASGKLCGRYTVEAENFTQKKGLVCFEQQEEWLKAPLQLPNNN